MNCGKTTFEQVSTTLSPLPGQDPDSPAKAATLSAWRALASNLAAIVQLWCTGGYQDEVNQNSS